jgi:cellulose biosynthesis protein BcsQ
VRVFVFDINEEKRGILLARLEEALRQSGLKHGQLIEGDYKTLSSMVAKGTPDSVVLGPGCYGDLNQSLMKIRSLYPTAPLAVVLENEVYAAEAVELRRSITARIMPLADIGQMAQFLLDCDTQSGGVSGGRNLGTVFVAQFKGGVGATTISCGLASCWARHGHSVCLLDLDDVNPQLTCWARVGQAERSLAAEFLRLGEVPQYRLKELCEEVAGFDGTLRVIGQPLLYGEGFHMKAEILAQAPSAAVYMSSLLASLQGEFDVVVIDGGRSWGISSFAALPFCKNVVMVINDDQTSLARSLETFMRMYRESDDPREFDLNKWTILLNAHAGGGLDPEYVAKAVAELDSFPEALDLFTIPLSERGRDWTLGETAFYDAADDKTKAVLREVAFSLVPFRFEHNKTPLFSNLRQGLKNLFAP